MFKFNLLKSAFSFVLSLLIVASLILPSHAASTMTSKLLAAVIPSETKSETSNEQITASKLEAPSDAPVISAEAAIVIDSERGQVLYSKQPEKRLQSSVANKIMTALVVIESTPLDAKITIPKESSSTQNNTISMEAGVKFPVEDLLYALMLTSSNQSANVLADHVGGSVLKFAEIMNKKASDIGMKNTNFINASGQYDEAQYTTAQDIAVLIRYALKNSYFKNLFFSTKARPWLTESDSDILINQNILFWVYDGVNGGTYGFAEATFQTAVTSAQFGIQTLITIVLSSRKVDVFGQSVQLFDYGFSKFKKGLLVAKGQSLKALNIAGQTVELINIENCYYTFPVGDDYIKSLGFLDKEIKLPIRKDYPLSSARYVLKDDMIIEIPLYPSIEINVPANLKNVIVKKLTAYKDIFILLFFLVLLEFIIIMYNISRMIKKSFNKRKYLKG